MASINSIELLLIILMLATSSTNLVLSQYEMVNTDVIDYADFMDTLCSNNKAGIGKVSTIIGLGRFLGPYTGGESSIDYTLCNLNQYHEVLTELVETVQDTDYIGDCSIDRIGKISKFHWKYVPIMKSTHAVPARKAPNALLNFFINYVNRVASICGAQMEENLNKMLNAYSLFAGDKSGIIQRAGDLLSSADLGVVRGDSIARLGDFSLPWINEVERLRQRGAPIDDLVAANRVGHFLAKVKFSGDMDQINLVMNSCRSRLRPVYQDTILPLMMLMELGYGDPMKVIESEVVKEWYEITQVCEVMLRVSFEEDPIIGNDRIKRVSRMSQQEMMESFRYMDSNPLLPRISKVDLVSNSATNGPVKDQLFSMRMFLKQRQPHYLLM